jgi:ABC-type sugar transport system ATPase subunit
MAEVVLEGVSKTYPGGVRAVCDLSLRVADGELIALLGPSGCGKTTLLRLIAGLETPTTGVIRLDGESVEGIPPHRRNVAMVFQRPALYPHLTVRQNLAFGLPGFRSLQWWWALRRWFGGGALVPKIAHAAGVLRLTDVLDRRPAELSGGQQQRVALGRALVRRPAVFLLDEPLSGLDAPLRLEMRRELHLLRRRLQATMIYVTHDQEEALALGDRVVVLDRGVVQQVGPPAAVYERPANGFVARFLGWPPMNLLDGELRAAPEPSFQAGGQQLALPATTWGRWREFAGRSVTLGVRPERVRIAAGVDRNGDDEATLDMDVRLVERAGSTTLITLQRGDWTVIARQEDQPSSHFLLPNPEGERVTVGLDLSRAHLFDPATGRALR